jgi:hypothetical protein
MSQELTPLNADEKKWGAVMHISALLGLLLAPGLVLGPFIVWFLKKQDSEYLNLQGKKAINFQLTILIAVFLLLMLSIIIRPIFAVAFMVGITGIVFAIMAGVSTYKEGDFNYPFSFNILK